jgi:crotonobetainyl-CoA:carnitine CoA-transferase CaiB-like acyl-CoA transferase
MGRSAPRQPTSTRSSFGKANHRPRGSAPRQAARFSKARSAKIRVIGRPDLLTDPRFSDPAKLVANMPELTSILDEIFCAQPMAHWYKVFNGVHVTFGAVRGPQEVVNDPQLRANDIIVPLDGAGGKLTSTISSPLQVHGVAKVSAKRAPKIGEHNEEVLRQLGFSATEIDGLHQSGAIPKAKEHAV